MTFLSVYLLIGVILGSYVGYKLFCKSVEQRIQIAQETQAPLWLLDPIVLGLIVVLVWPIALTAWLTAL